MDITAFPENLLFTCNIFTYLLGRDRMVVGFTTTYAISVDHSEMYNTM
jgi:hypothetical protein